MAKKIISQQEERVLKMIQESSKLFPSRKEIAKQQKLEQKIKQRELD